MSQAWLPEDVEGEAEPSHLISNTDSGEDFMKDTHRRYFARRLTEARLAAASASDPTAKLTHRSFAQLYEARLGVSFQNPQPSPVDFDATPPLEDNFR
jgi:hypothetical protein